MKPEEAVTAARQGAGWVRLDRLSLLRVSGPNRVKFLHNLLSNDIAGLTGGTSRRAALMNLKGQQVAWMRVLALSDSLICELPAAVRDTVMETFIHYKVGAPVRFEKLDSVVFGILGSRASKALASLGLPAGPEASETFSAGEALGGGVRVSRSGELPASGFLIHAEPKAAAAIEEKLQSSLGAPVSENTLETLRVEEGIPWHGVDVMEENLLHETGQLEVYHSNSKGCYLGQEVVARLEGRGGNVNKRFRGLKCSKPISASDELVADDDGKVIGRVTSAGHSPEFGYIAMGYVHRSHATPGTRVTTRGAETEVTTLPFRN